ncbi:MAG: PQQ-binding-like beta-propeller repeat protein [Planctomycetia bacterium]|nr:PQQ-binding-like beta-propeller repeat protein [Planctomycetia bacterium]
MMKSRRRALWLLAAGCLAVAVAIILSAKVASFFGGPGAGTREDGAGPAEGWADESEWPMFRGGQALLGVSRSKVPDSPVLLWQFETGGAVESSAAIVRGRVFVGSDDGKVYALDLAEGKKLWEYQTGGSVKSSPLVIGGAVFVGSSDEHLYAIDADTGDLRWKYKTGKKILGGANWTLSPEGNRLWILAGSYDGKLYCLDSQSGEEVWTYATSYFINGTVAVAGGKAIFGGCDKVIHVVSVADGSEILAVKPEDYMAASAALARNRAYVGNFATELLCVDIVSGETDWTYSGAGSAFYSSAAVAEGKVVVGSRDKRVHCVSRKDGEKLWTFPTRGDVDSSPVICDGKVVVGSSDGRLYILRLSDGEEVWSYEIGGSISAYPAVAPGVIGIGSMDGSVYAFGAKRPAANGRGE